MDQNKRKRQAISLSIKIKVIEDFEKGLPIEAIADKYELNNRSNVYRILENKEKIKEKGQQIDEKLHEGVKKLKCEIS
jgi:hypothetical protein